jgi:hypothetical protein
MRFFLELSGHRTDFSHAHYVVGIIRFSAAARRPAYPRGLALQFTTAAPRHHYERVGQPERAHGLGVGACCQRGLLPDVDRHRAPTTCAMWWTTKSR